MKAISGIYVVSGDVASVVDRHCLNRDPAWVIDSGERSIDQRKAVEHTVGTLVPADDLAGSVDGRRDREGGFREIDLRDRSTSQDEAVCSAIGRVEASDNGQLATGAWIVPIVGGVVAAILAVLIVALML